MLTKIEHGDILELRLERPPVNALHHPLVQELKAAIEAAPKQGAKALVLSGVAGLYSAGQDVPYLLGVDRAGI
jgi:3,2-trans-enoyl-CoA isomerase